MVEHTEISFVFKVSIKNDTVLDAMFFPQGSTNLRPNYLYRVHARQQKHHPGIQTVLVREVGRLGG